jgi:hypothetical protein
MITLTTTEVTQDMKRIVKEMISRKRKINNNLMYSSKERKLIIYFSLTALQRIMLPKYLLFRIMM